MPLPSAGKNSDFQSNSFFQTTHWSIVLAAGQVSATHKAAALQSLCQTYWRPLYAYVRRRVVQEDQALDLTQSFFAELLEKNHIGVAAPERGRFRAFLLTAFKHFLSKQWDQAKTQKRGGGQTVISLEVSNADAPYRFEPYTRLTPEQLYDRQWAITLLELVMLRLENEFAERGKSDQFCHLKDFAIGDHTGMTYADVAAALGTTEAAAKMAAHRLRQRYRRLLRDEIAQTVATPDEIDDEIRILFAVLSLHK